MKKIVLFLLLFIAAISFAQAQKSSVVVEQDDYTQLRVRFDVGEPSFQKSRVGNQNQEYTILDINGCMPSSRVGAPMLPTFSNLIEVPLCAGFAVEVAGAVYDTIQIEGSPLMPLQPSRSKSDFGRHDFVIDESIYSANEYYGVDIAIVEEVGIARDRRLARLQFSPVRYNPVSGTLIVCRTAIVTVRYEGVREVETNEMFERYYSPAYSGAANVLNNLYKSVRTAAPVRYLIVAHSSFRNQMDTFVQWKRRKGFITDIVYTGDAGVGTTNTSISAYVISQYTNATTANPAPTYLLIVGDHEQIPAFDAQVTSPSSDHITDLYYASWTMGDNIPDCYYGRFSAQTVSQLTPQIEKTLMYEQYTFADPSFLDRAVMVAGVDGGSSGDYGYTHADPAMDYAITNYVNGSHGFSQVKYFKNNTSIVPTGSNVTVGSSASSNSSTVRNCYNDGAGWINYSAHGSATSWGTPSFTTTNASSMTNTQKFGIMIGNCCLTNKFETTTCLGESVLRKGNYCGAVGYIGGSNSTYWNEDFYWAVGLRSGISATMSMAYNSSNLGGYDRIFHTHNETRTAWVTTQGELMFQGNMAVQGSTSSLKNYYWEIYHLMGDPSLMPYLTQASTMPLSAPSSCVPGVTSLTVTAAPYAYVAVTRQSDHTLMGAAFANASGNATISLTPMDVGTYEVVATAQQYQPAYSTLNVLPTSGAYLQIVSIEPLSSLDAGATVQFSIRLTNIGNGNATNVSVALNSDNSMLAIGSNLITVSSIAPGDTVTRTFSSTVSAMADGSYATVGASATWSGSSTPVTNSINVRLGTPYGTSFEEGTFGSDWQQGTYPWEITGGTSSDGSYSARSSSSLTHSQTSELSITIEAAHNDTVSFYYRVSSEANYDKFHFYIDNVEKVVESGVVDWTQAIFPVTAGSHVLKFTYSKDVSVSSNSDCAWIDDVRLPRPLPQYTVTVSAMNGTATGSGNYRLGDTAFVGVYPQAGYHFVRWNDNNLSNPRQVVVLADATYQALLLQVGDQVHDTTFVDVPYPVHDTTVITLTDTVMLTQYVSVHDTAFIDVPYLVHDTTVVIRTDTVTEYVPVHDTTFIDVPYAVHDTAYIDIPYAVHDTIVVTLTDTVLKTEYVTLHDTTYMNVSDTVYVEVPYAVHDTTVVTLLDTLILTEHILVHDTATVTLIDTVVLFDTITLTVPVHDTSYVDLYFHDTVTVIQVDTITLTEYLQVHDTAFVDVIIHDTAFVTQTDTLTLVEYVTVYDTTYQEVHDTTYINQFVHDTTVVVQFDTVRLTEYVLLHDTTIVILTDTLINTVHDTVINIVYDTVVNTVVDTVINIVFDTVVNTVFDTVINTVYETTLLFDTTYVTDTVWLTQYDTIWLTDTIIIHDTVYIVQEGVEDLEALNVKIYQQEGQLVVDGANGSKVYIYDVLGRILATKQDEYTVMRFNVPASGTYLVKVGELPARRIVVIR